MPSSLSKDKRKLVEQLLEQGRSDREISRLAGISLSTSYRWRTNGIPISRPEMKVDRSAWSLVQEIDYPYLLGLYLGDGYIGTRGRSHSLVIACDGKYMANIRECVEAVSTFAPKSPAVIAEKSSNGKRVVSHDPSWPELFPQHGPGKKMDRRIELSEWQQELVDRYPKQLLRGLIQSDGSRCENKVNVTLKSGPKEYLYTRYFFTNYSEDIRTIFTHTCDQLGIRWSQSSWRNISVSHRDSVARLDQFVGPKA